MNPHIYIICLKEGENNDHLFMHCEFANGLWTRLFEIGWEEWIALRRIKDFLFTNFHGFGGNRDFKKL